MKTKYWLIGLGLALAGCDDDTDLFMPTVDPSAGTSDTGSDETDQDTDGGTGGTGEGGTTDDGGTDEPDDSGPSTPRNCGDGVLDGGEECDGDELSGNTCVDFGFESGTLGCLENCRWDTTTCQKCGDNQVQEGEVCDGMDLGLDAMTGRPPTCSDVGAFATGELGCSDDCQAYVTDACNPAVCGDGVITESAGEACDGDELGGATCAGLEDFVGGDLTCTANCELDTSQCRVPVCGDGMAEGDEPCDGADFGGSTCQSVGMAEGFGAGELACNVDCTIDTSACIVCGAQLSPCATDDDCCPGITCNTFVGFCI